MDMDELLLITARAHQRDLQAQRNPNRRLRWRRLRTGRANVVALPRHGAPRITAGPSFDDAA